MRYAVIVELNTDSGHGVAFTIKARESMDASAAQNKADAIIWELQKAGAIGQWRSVTIIPVLRFRDWIDTQCPARFRPFLLADWSQLPEARHSKQHGPSGAAFVINPAGKGRTYKLAILQKEAA